MAFPIKKSLSALESVVKIDQRLTTILDVEQVFDKELSEDNVKRRFSIEVEYVDRLFEGEE